MSCRFDLYAPRRQGRDGQFHAGKSAPSLPDHRANSAATLACDDLMDYGCSKILRDIAPRREFGELRFASVTRLSYPTKPLASLNQSQCLWTASRVFGIGKLCKVAFFA